MKNPIRNVVVEYKNRRARKGGNSLWGNLDLKSIARDVEEDSKAPAPVEPTQPAISETSSQPAAKILEPTPQVEAVVEPKIVVADTPETIAAETEVAPQETQKPAAAKATTSSARTRKKLNAPRRLQTLADKPVKVKPVPKATVDILDELAALEAENVALKRQLAEKLSIENKRMRKMLNS
ncbi:hypothetical protein QBD01_003331 [Ochrobactrum sp. 19YEA23]|uniref:hypothetical protein n=1 Tax=Ochrobactrum sp. 19YEA23 TaxID=3039854 RepID=UPI0024787D2A|nr:hypothetical protein [Ochrobactrum sp. 19YEA23]